MILLEALVPGPSVTGFHAFIGKVPDQADGVYRLADGVYRLTEFT